MCETKKLCIACKGHGEDIDEIEEESVTCPDCAGTGKAETSITYNETGKYYDKN